MERVLSCGCILCICEDSAQCHGCGAKMCDGDYLTCEILSGRFMSDAESAELSRLREFEAAVRRVVCDTEGEDLAVGEPAESVQLGRLQVADEIRAALTRLDDGRKG